MSDKLEAAVALGYAEFDFRMLWSLTAEKVRSGLNFVFDGHLVAKRCGQTEPRQVSSVSSAAEPLISVRIALEEKWNPSGKAVLDRPRSGTTPARPVRSDLVEMNSSMRVMPIRIILAVWSFL